MKVWHRTSSADAILEHGFRDAEGSYGTGADHEGVWVANVALGPNEGAIGDTHLVLDVPDSRLIEFEWVEDGKPHREFLVRADLPNDYGPPATVTVDDL